MTKKHFLLKSPVAESSHPPGPISSFPNKGRKWLHPRISLWTRESVLWNSVSLGVSVCSPRLLPQREKGADRQWHNFTPWRYKSVGFFSKWVNEWRKFSSCFFFFFPSFFCLLIPSSPLHLLNSIRSTNGESTSQDNYSKAVRLHNVVYDRKGSYPGFYKGV